MGKNMICKGTTENNYIQAYIVNLTYQSSFENIVKYDSNVEKLINEINQKNGFLEEWTAPRWAGIGDIVFFMQSKGTAQTIFKHQKPTCHIKSSFICCRNSVW